VSNSTSPTHFHHAPRAALRAVPSWDRLGYIQSRLPAVIADAIRGLELPPHARILDFGCADSPYRSALPVASEYVAADLVGNPNATVHIGADGRLPLDGEQFDAILSTQVLEHVEDPAIYLGECRRLLKQDGRLLLSTHGIMIYHPDPVDYWRWTGPGLRHELEAAGLQIESLSGFMGLTATGLQLFQDGLYRRLPRRIRRLFTGLIQWLIARLDRGESADSRSTNALVFIVVARKTARS